MNLLSLFDDVKSGGFTYHFEGGNMAKQPFFAVSMPNNEKNLGINPDPNTFYTEIANLVTRMVGMDNHMLAIGGWLNKKGEVILDITELIPTSKGLDFAIKKGKDRKQEAIFNLETMQEYGLTEEGITY